MKLKRSGIITKIVVFALIIYAVANLLSLRAKIDDARDKQTEIKKQVTERELLNAELEYEIEHSEDDEVIAKIARSDFGLVMPGEVVFYEGGGQSAD